MRYGYGGALKNSDRRMQTDVFDSRKQHYQPLKTAHRISLPESKIVYIEISSHLSLFIELLIQNVATFAEIIPARYALCSSLQKHRDHTYVQCKGWCQQLGDSKPTALYAYQGWLGQFTVKSLSSERMLFRL